MNRFFEFILGRRQRISAVLFCLLIVVAGLWSLRHMPMDAIPDVSDRQVIIYIEWSGQDPGVIQDQVTYPVVTTMQHVPHMKSVRGYSTFGFALVYVLLKDDVDLYWARSRVLEYLTQIRSVLPADPALNVGLGPDATGVGWVYQYALRSQERTLTELRSIQDWYLRYGLQSLPDVSEVASVGGAVKEYQVAVNPERLRAYDIPLDSVIRRVQASNAQQGGRWIENAGAEYLIRGLGYIQSKEDIEKVVLRADENGVPVTVADVGDVVIGMQQRRGAVDLNGTGEVVGGIVVARDGADVAGVVRDVKDKLAELQASLPEDVEIVPVYDRSEFIDESVASVRDALLLEMAFVVLVVLLFLAHVRSALAVLLSLPIALLGALTLLQAFGITLNIMTLSGIAIAIGTMVDAAIVLVENAYKHLERLPEGESGSNARRIRAVLDSLCEVTVPILVSMAIIVLAFLPVLLLEGEEGRLFRPLVLAKTFAILCEMVLVLVLMPLLMVVFLKGRIRREEKSLVNSVLMKLYHHALWFCLGHRWTVVIVTAIAVLTAGAAYDRLGSEFLPPVFEGDFMYMPTTVPGVSITEMMQVVERQDALLKEIPEVEAVFGKAGRAETATDPAPLAMIETIVKLKPRQQWRAGVTKDDIEKEMDEKIAIPGLTNSWTMPIRGRIDMLSTGIKTPLGLKVYGPDYRTVDQVSHRIQDTLEELPETKSVFADKTTLGRYIDFSFDREAMQRYDVHIDDVQRVIRYGIGGGRVSTTIEGLERYPVTVRYQASARSDPDRMLDHVLVYSHTFGFIPLYYVASARVSEAPTEIKTENGMPVNYVYVEPDTPNIGDYVSLASREIGRSVELPPAVYYQWSGQYEGIERARARLIYVVPAVLLVILILYYLLYGTLSNTLIVLLSIPFSLTGAVWLMWLLDYHMSVAVVVGMLALVGVSAQTAVVMLIYLEHAVDKWRAEGRLKTREDLFSAIYEGAVLRLRPKTMTVLTIIFSLLPLLIATGVGANIAKRIAAPLIGGMVSSAILVLLIIPAVYSWAQQRHLRPREDGHESSES